MGNGIGDPSQAQSFIRQFEEQGYIILKNILDQEYVQLAISAMKRLVDNEAEKLMKQNKIQDPLLSEPFETRLYKLYADHIDDAPKSFRKELHVPELFYLFFNPELLDWITFILGDEIRLYPNYTARPKLPDWEGTEVLWHQDAGYTGGDAHALEQLRMVNVWTPLVPVNAVNGCMQFIPGTHKLGAVPHESKKYYLQIAEEVLAPRLHLAVDIVLDPGDVVLFNNLLFHQGQPNRSRQIRWSIDWRYQDATQPTQRKEQGHIARSKSNPSSAVHSPEEWAQRTFG
jgi:ectoine hydroxylase-related dioxygenase (phytanoyl-CoA dioxygenase family)